MPTPAVPAPNTTSFCWRIGTPVTWTAARIRRALPGPKSSKCSSAFGNSADAVSRYFLMKES